MWVLLGLDLYLCLTYRTFGLTRPLRLTWSQLYRQFGADPAMAGARRTQAQAQRLRPCRRLPPTGAARRRRPELAGQYTQEQKNHAKWIGELGVRVTTLTDAYDSLFENVDRMIEASNRVTRELNELLQ